MDKKKVNFGFKIINEDQKDNLVQTVFSDVAAKYDLMNDIMSFGLHRLWKNELISNIDYTKGSVLLDLAGGTGDIALKFIKKGGKKAVVCDLNESMLRHGQDKLLDRGICNLPIETVCANAESLPFADNSFDYCAISFGIRNFTNIPKALKEVKRVLKPMGKFLCLEFSQIDSKLLRKIYEQYLFKVIPKIGKIIANNEQHYLYLSESIKLFPKASEFATMIDHAGFESISYKKILFGIVAIHTAYSI